jgi:hypothetical protein
VDDADNPEQASPEPDPNPPPPLPIVPPKNKAILGDPKPDPPQEEEEETRELIGETRTENQETRTIEWLQFGINAALAVIGVIAIIVYNCQLSVMKSTLNQIAMQTPNIGRQATAAENGVAEVQRQTRLDERPWIRFRPPEPEPSQPPPSFTATIGEKFQIPIEFMNYGKTAALRIKAFVIIEVLRNGQKPHLPKEGHLFVRFPEEVRPKGSHVIKTLPYDGIEAALVYPGERQNVLATWKQFGRSGTIENRIMSRDELMSIYNKTSYIAVWGQAEYWDIFDVEHWTRFCSTEGYGDFHPRVEECLRFADVDRNDSANQPQNQERPYNPN